MKNTEVFTCSCTTTNCDCRKKFSSTYTTTNPITITSEMFINGEKVTKDNSIKVIFNKIKSKQRKKDIKNAMKQKKELQKINKDWVLN
jgi:hypothetical protein